MENQIEKRDLLTIGEASLYLGVSIDTLRRWEKRGRLEPFRSPGGHRYYERKELDKLFGKRYTRDEETAQHQTVLPEPEIIEEKSVVEPVPTIQMSAIKISEYKQITIMPLSPTLTPREIPIRPTREFAVPKVESIRITQYKEEPTQAIIEKQETQKNAQNEVLVPERTASPPIISENRKKPDLHENIGTIIIVSVLILVIILGGILFYMLFRSQSVLSPI